MPLPYGGTTLSINNRPAAGVDVRVFDIDDPVGNSDELSFNPPAQSGSDGGYFNFYEPLWGIDFVDRDVEIVYYEFRDPRHGDFRLVRRVRHVNVRVPDTSDSYDPALDFRYQASGRSFLVRRSGFPDPMVLPHVVNPEAMTGSHQVCVAVAASGHPVLFARGADGKIWIVNDLGGGGMCSAQDLGDASRTLGVFRVARNQDGRLELFGISAAGELLHCWEDRAGGSWSGLASLGGQIGTGSGLAVEADAAGLLTVFARGTGGGLRSIQQGGNAGSWRAWQSLGGSIHERGGIAVVRDQGGKLNVFYQGSDFQIWGVRQAEGSGSWSGLATFGARTVPGPLGVASNSDGRLEIFAQTIDGAIAHRWQLGEGGWSQWESLGGIWVAGSLEVGRYNDGRLVVAVQGTNRHFFVRSQHVANSWWDGWADLGSPLSTGWTPPLPPADAVTLGYLPAGQLALAWRTPEGRVFVKIQTIANGAWGAWLDRGTLPPPPPLAAPVLERVIPGNQRIDVSWSSVSGTEHYLVFYVAVGTSNVHRQETTSTQTVIGGLQNGVEYEIWVVAVNSCHTSPESNRLRARPDARPNLVAGYLYSSESIPKPNATFRVTSAVANSGTAASTPCTARIDREDHPTGGTVTQAYQDFQVPSLQPGQVLEMEWTQSLGAGEYYYWVTADTLNVVSESDETDNHAGYLGVVVTG